MLCFFRVLTLLQSLTSRAEITDSYQLESCDASCSWHHAYAGHFCAWLRDKLIHLHLGLLHFTAWQPPGLVKDDPICLGTAGLQHHQLCIALEVGQVQMFLTWIMVHIEYSKLAKHFESQLIVSDISVPGCNSCYASCYPVFALDNGCVVSRSLWLGRSSFVEEGPAPVTRAVPAKNKWLCE